VCSKEFRQPVTLPAIGMHNVSNALAAFAVGSLLDISPEQAAAALAAYVPSGMRQRVVKLEGLTVIEDCYNASPDSIEAALFALRDMPVKGRRIAVLGDMLELGSYAEREHLKCGVIARSSGVDLLFAYGENAKYYDEGAGKGTLYKDKSELAASLLRELKQGDAVLFKASRGMKLEDIIKEIYEGWNKK
jgi:UDP-N-acetylmuramoyl-tripeptide--D-alanyl-D-alanine ligase